MASAEWFVNCPKGLEGLLAEELVALGAESFRETVAGVYVSGEAELPYKVCLWSRLANRVLLPLDKFPADTADELYRGARAIAWDTLLREGATLAVDFVGKNDGIRHTQFGAQKVKDAIVDAITAAGGARPDVDLRHPDFRVNVHLARGRAALSIDLSGESLHRRGYRNAMVPAPLKENLAAALLLRAEWPAICAKGGPLIDPMCGSGTLLIEAAMMAADIAPGLKRRKWGFQGWQGYDESCWQNLVEDAQARRQQGLQKELPEIRGYDKDRKAIDATLENCEILGLERIVRVMPKPVAALKQPTHTQLAPGLIITNPPYGERWGEMEELRPLYQRLGEVARTEFPGWRLAVFTGNKELAGELRLRSSKKYKLFNGTIAAELLLFELREDVADRTQKTTDRPLSDAAQMLANRLQKNQRKLQPWLKREQVTCYRLYDKDLPEYAVAIDIYGDSIHVQEYAPPASIDEQQARQRLLDVRRVLMSVYPEAKDKLHFKERRRQKGESQYQRQTPWHQESNRQVVSEGRAKVEVNLEDYLDTGLFLDHRPVRQMIAEQSRGKRFLNLFCYTAVATVQAALGGAKTSVSVDMSNTYLDWAKRNFELNAISTNNHQLVRADCLAWLDECKQTFDLIFLDPPTFSNSKKMDNVLDVQRDHGVMIDKAMRLLAAEGTLLFSTNFRRFKLDQALEEKYSIEDISEQSIPPDFQRNNRIHRCWVIRHSDS